MTTMRQWLGRRRLALACGTLFALCGGGAAYGQDAASSPDRPGEARGVIPLPRTDVFHPLMADPKQPQFRASHLWTSTGARRTRVGAVAFGENFGIVRWVGRDTTEGWQLSLAGAVFAQFDLQTESFDLMNADYVIGIPLTHRRGATSARVRLYHQSSHLGDEYLLRSGAERINIQWESIEAIVARELGDVRVYGGGEYMLHREPATLRAGAWHGGVEYHHPKPVVGVGAIGRGWLVAALDARGWAEHAWRPGWSGKAGLEFGPAPARSDDGRRWSILVEAYDGPSPYGQFYAVDVSYVGVGLYFMF